MPISHAQYLEMLQRPGLRQKESKLSDGEPATCESKLHSEISNWCYAQWPRWKIIRARMDKRSTIGQGIHDLTVFGPHPLVLCVECKRKDEKLKKKQQIWAAELKLLGWTVQVVRSMADFKRAIEAATFGAETRISTVNQAKNNLK